MPLIWPNGCAIAAAVTVVGITNTIGNGVSQSLRQRLVPRILLARVGGASRTPSFGLMLLGGVIAERAGLPATFLSAVALSLLAYCHLVLTVRTADVRAAEPAGLTSP